MTTNFGTQLGFWDKQHRRLVGDLINRPKVIEKLGTVAGMHVLDAGCGTGNMTRTLASKGAIMHAVDRDVGTLARAIEHEHVEQLGIAYSKADIADLPYQNQLFSRILCVSVLMYCSPEEVRRFFREAARVLRGGGTLIVAVTHPYMYEREHAGEIRGAPWLQLTPLTRKGTFRQRYFDSAGECSTLIVWNHTMAEYINPAIATGLRLTHVDEIVFSEELSDVWGGGWGYPAYLHLCFRTT